MKELLIIAFILVANSLLAQSGFKVDEAGVNRLPNASAVLDAEATTKGILIPQLALTATNVAAPVTTPANSLLIFNTATAGSGATAVTPGFYYWDTTSSLWIPLIDNSKGASVDSSEWIDGSKIGLPAGNIYARKAFENGDTVVIKGPFFPGGALGIGEPNPQAQLHVFGSGIVENNSGAFFTIRNTSDTKRAQFQTNNSTLELVGSGGRYFINRFAPNGLTLVAGGGDVTVGSIAPAPARLSVRGSTADATDNALSVLDSNQVAGYNQLFVVRNDGNVAVGSQTPQARFHVANDEDATYDSAFVVTNQGKVGIGTIAPVNRLDVLTTTPTGILAKFKRTDVNEETLSIFSGYLNNSGIVATDRLTLYAGITEDTAPPVSAPFTLMPSGYLGIGTSNPLGKLHVENDQDGVRDSVFIIRNSGLVGIGTPSPSSKLDIDVPISTGALEITTPNSSFFIQEDSDILGYTNFRNNGGKGFVFSALPDNPDIVIKDTLLGSVGFGTINPAAKLHIANIAGSVDFRYGDLQDAIGTGGQGVVFDGGRSYYKIASAAATKVMTFFNTNGEVGSIETSGTTTTFNTTSDKRLKTNFKEIQDALKTINLIEVKEYAYKDDTTIRMDGFLAQQLEDIVPYAVSGSKYDMGYDPLDEDPQNPLMVDYSKLVPLLTKAIQEQQLMIENLLDDNKSKENEINRLKVEVDKIKIFEQELSKIKLLLDKNELGTKE